MLKFTQFLFSHIKKPKMYLSSLDIFDLFIRFLTVGQLSLLGIYVLSKSCNLKSVLATVFAVCLCSYILLTTPIADEHYGLLRGILLFFTEIAPYILWCFALRILSIRISTMFNQKICKLFRIILILFLVLGNQM